MKLIWRLFLPVIVIWSVYRIFFNFPETVDEFIVKPLIFILLPLYLARYHTIPGFAKNRRVPGFENKRGIFEDLITGVAMAFVFAFGALIINKLKYGVFLIIPILPLVGWGSLVYLLLSIATSISEEVLGRGFFFNGLKKKSTIFLPAVMSSLMVLSIHLPVVVTKRQYNPQTLLVYLCSIFLLSMTNTYIYKFRGNLVLPVLIHAFWNMTVAVYL